ncbi:hypothetical protein [Robbsia sp. KACC 23696]|uniref:hypothetical protein n=1 Tax=Robbsia sp. KACC 23696 TaxID=3149231 RepID=UPI00325A6D22
MIRLFRFRLAAGDKVRLQFHSIQNALRPDTPLFVVLQLAGCAYLLYLGALFLRYAGSNDLNAAASGGRGSPPDLPPALVFNGCRVRR